jgi:hypothetical protein
MTEQVFAQKGCGRLFLFTSVHSCIFSLLPFASAGTHIGGSIVALTP